MDTYSVGIVSALKKYIDSEGADGKEELRQLLQQTSSVDRYILLMNVRGEKWWGNTGPQMAAWHNDLETMKFMLEGLTRKQKYRVLKIQAESIGRTTLHYAAGPGHSSIITYLLTDLPQEQKFNLLQLQDVDGDTPLCHAATYQKSEAVQAILTSLSLPLLLQLVIIRNKKGDSAVHIRPEIYGKLLVQTLEGITLHVLYIYY